LDSPGILCRGPRRYSFRRARDGFGARREAAGLIKRRSLGGGRCEERNEDEINFPYDVHGGRRSLRFDELGFRGRRRGGGRKGLRKCKACHQVGETAKNAIAPELNGIDGRAAGASAGYNYSDAMKGSGITWDAASFKEFIKNPKAKIPGTKMVFQGLPSDTDEDNVWAYLSGFGADGKKK